MLNYNFELASSRRSPNSEVSSDLMTIKIMLATSNKANIDITTITTIAPMLNLLNGIGNIYFLLGKWKKRN